MAKYQNKGDLSNLFTFLVMIVGIILEVWVFEEDQREYNYILNVGLFGFAGGITNWLAIHMLFEKVPGLYGSGVIPLRFKEIRETVKDTMMQTFFDEAYLQQYIGEKAPVMLEKLDLSGRVTGFLQRPDFDAMLVTKLEELSAKPEGAMLAMIKNMMSFAMMVPMLKPVLVTLGQDG